MARTNYKQLYKKILVDFIGQENPILAMLEWTAQRMMEIEAEAKVGAEKGRHIFQEQESGAWMTWPPPYTHIYK